MASLRRHSAIDKVKLRHLIGEPDFSRGLSYFERGRVVEARLDAKRILAKGQVAGSGSKPYRQDVALRWNNAGQLARINGHCSCPVGVNCKHVAALMLKLLPELNGQTNELTPVMNAPRRRAEESEVPGDLQGWLGRLEEIETTASAQNGKPKAERLYYVLAASATGDLDIELFKVRTLKSGELSKSPQRYTLSANMPVAAFLDMADASILSRLLHLQRARHRGGYGVRFDATHIEPPTLTGLVREIVETGRARAISLRHPPLVWGAPRDGHFLWRDEPDGTQQLYAVGADGRELATLPLIPPLFVDTASGACGEFRTAAEPRLAHALVTMPPVPPASARKIAKALTRFKAAPPPQEIDIDCREDVKPTPVLKLFACEGQLMPLGRRFGWGEANAVKLTVPVLRLIFDYSGRLVDQSDTRNVEYKERGKLVTIVRDDAFEAEAATRLQALEEFGFFEIDQMARELYGIKKTRRGDLMFDIESDTYLSHELDFLAMDFQKEALPALEAEGWRIEIDKSWPYRFYDGELNIQAGVDSGERNWFSLSLTAVAGDQQVDLLPSVLEIIKALDLVEEDAGEDGELEALLEDMTLFLDLPDGSRAPVSGSELAPLIRACLAAKGLLEGFHQGEAGEFKKLSEALEGCGVPFHGGERLLALGHKLQALQAMPEVEPPASLQADLRHYQKTGYGWLDALAETGFGGVLADDMGLGKTVQALAILCKRHLEQHAARPSLLVVPTSLIGNWQREVQRFAPDLKLLVLHGPDRHRHFGAMAEHHLVVTTYPLLHRDHLKLFAEPFELAILDEAQAVKNPASSAAKIIREIDARQRIALTGTPIENNLEELWSIYDWVVPGLLGDRKTFKKLFRGAIEQDGDAAAGQKLATRIRPFLLRRTKEQVAADLPPKTEIDEIVRLDGKQRDLYETIRVAMDARVRETIAAKGLAATRITVLDALLKMRQACCDPALVKLDAAQKIKDSAKRARLAEMLSELLAEGRKILIFSQFVEMLRLIEQDLIAKNIDYVMLTGQTKKRAQIVDRFQSGQVPVFLISLKAGGVGLNLTAADTVILYDPWWNPAVERQAMDRTHRIGQDKPVFVYKMIAEGSVEAAIQAMQAQKRTLADNLFDGTQSGGLAIGEQDIQALFAPLA